MQTQIRTLQLAATGYIVPTFNVSNLFYIDDRKLLRERKHYDGYEHQSTSCDSIIRDMIYGGTILMKI